MESGGSSSFGMGNKAQKGVRHRRAWTPVEERALADLMKDLVARGWRSENGFKPGYLQKLEAGMAEKLPGTDIKADPHINSRITIWKKAQGSLLTMLKDNSGIGFNPATGMIDCHNDAWALIVKADPNATNMRFKAWPLYEDWNEIFGKDRANGGNAEDVRQAVNKLVDEQRSQAGEQNHNCSGLEREQMPVDMEVTSECPTVHMTLASRKIGKKRGVGEPPSDDKLCNVLSQVSNAADTRIDNLVRVMASDSGIGNARRELPGILDAMTCITEDEKVDAAHLLAKNSDCLEMFIGMTDSKRALYVRRLLSGHLKM